MISPQGKLIFTTVPAKEKYLSSQWESAELIRAVTGGGAFSNADHLRTLGEESRDGQKDRDVANETKLKGLVRYLKGTDRRLILRAKSTGAWMSVRDTTAWMKSLTMFSGALHPLHHYKSNLAHLLAF